LDSHVLVSDFCGKVKWVQIDIDVAAKDVLYDWSRGVVHHPVLPTGNYFHR